MHSHLFNSLAPGVPSDASLLYPYAKGACTTCSLLNPLAVDDVNTSEPDQQDQMTTVMMMMVPLALPTTCATSSINGKQTPDNSTLGYAPASPPPVEHEILRYYGNENQHPWFDNADGDRFVNPAITSLCADASDLVTFGQSAKHVVNSSGVNDDEEEFVPGPVIHPHLQEVAQMKQEGVHRNASCSLTTQSPSNSASYQSSGSGGAIRKRKQRESSQQQQQSKTLQIVQEDGQGHSFAPADFVGPPRGARRKGPLSTVTRANAGIRRKNKDTCVQCRLNKRKCDGHSPCDACRPTLIEQPCARACFANIVEYGTCNYISQRAINHPTVDGSRRVRMEIPSRFDLNDLLTFLRERQGRFNIRATQAWGSLYVLDLRETYRFLKSLSECNDNGRSSFLDFIDRRLVESKDQSKHWLSCLRDCDPMNNVYVSVAVMQIILLNCQC